MRNILTLLIISAFTLSACNPTADRSQPSNDAMPPAPQGGGEVMEKNDDDIVLSPDDSEEAMQDKGVFRNKIVFTKSEGVEKGEGEGFYDMMEGETRVYASFNVVKTEEDYFYEGWLICDGKPYSTGALEFFDGLYENTFASLELPRCESYVLTLEPNDGDPSPAEHILEGRIEGVAHTENTLDWDDERFTQLKFNPVRYTCTDAHQFTLAKDPLSGDKLFHTDTNSGKSTTLMAEKVASGEKFSSDDKKLSVWFKGEVAMIMEGEEITHQDCKKS